MERFISNFERQLFINEANRIEKLIDSGYLHELTEYNHWVVYKTEYWYNRRTKIPYSPLTSHRAKVNDPNTWSGYKPALNALRSGLFNGIGFVTTKDDPFIFVDVDQTAGYNREIYYPGRQAIELLRTCWQYSPGDGIHGIGRGVLPFTNKKIGKTEIYTSSHYMTLTFRHIPGNPTEILPIDTQILGIIQAREGFKMESDINILPTPKQPLQRCAKTLN